MKITDSLAHLRAKRPELFDLDPTSGLAKMMAEIEELDRKYKLLRDGMVQLKKSYMGKIRTAKPKRSAPQSVNDLSDKEFRALMKQLRSDD